MFAYVHAQVVLREYRHRNLESLGTLTSLWSTYNQAPLSDDRVDANRSPEAAAAAAAAGDAAGAAGAAMEVNAVSLCGAFPEKDAAVSSPGADKDATTSSNGNSSPTCLAVDLDGDGSVREMNAFHCRAYGYSKAQNLLRAFYPFFY